MPLEIHPILPDDTLSWSRIRAIAYAGPTHNLLHRGPITESSIHGVSEDRRLQLRKPNTWHWKIVDTDLPLSKDDPPNTPGRIIAIAAWSMQNVPLEGIDEISSVPADETPSFIPPELRMDAFHALLDPMRAAGSEIMGTKEQYFMLNSLATHPDQQGRGAAKMLLDWGLKKADEEGLVTYLTSASGARPIYEKRGFVLVKGIEFDRVPWGGEGVDWHGCMVRQPHKGGGV